MSRLARPHTVVPPRTDVLLAAISDAADLMAGRLDGVTATEIRSLLLIWETAYRPADVPA